MERIHVIVEMNPVDRVYVDAEKTLRELEQKKQELKKEQLQILDDYGYVTTAYQGTAHSVSVDEYGLKQMRGQIVTHNHPSDYGGTFSDVDINSLKSGMRELRASAAEGTYSLRASQKADPQSFYKAMVRSGPKLQEEMRKISKENAQKKYPSYKAYVKDNRRTQLAVLHDWYAKNAPNHGYTYTFTPNGEGDGE